MGHWAQRVKVILITWCLSFLSSKGAGTSWVTPEDCSDWMGLVSDGVFAQDWTWESKRSSATWFRTTLNLKKELSVLLLQLIHSKLSSHVKSLSHTGSMLFAAEALIVKWSMRSVPLLLFLLTVDMRCFDRVWIGLVFTLDVLVSRHPLMSD